MYTRLVLLLVTVAVVGSVADINSEQKRDLMDAIIDALFEFPDFGQHLGNLPKVHWPKIQHGLKTRTEPRLLRIGDKVYIMPNRALKRKLRRRITLV